MKIRTMIVMLLIGVTQVLSGQCLWSNKSINTKLGSTIDSFRWLDERYLIYTEPRQTKPDTIWSPFSSKNNANDNINGFIVSEPKDNDPTDGWEVVLKNFGAPSDPYTNPTLVLYNRYSGILRVFVYVPYSETFNRNTAKIDMTFQYLTGGDKIESALLAPLASPLLALDKFKKKIAASTVQRTKSKGLFWMYADFPVNYDPCTCKQLTAINILPNFINIQEVNLLASVQKKNLATNGVSSPNFLSTISHSVDYVTKGIDASKKRGTQVGATATDIGNFLDKNVFPNFDYKTTRLTVSGSPDDEIVPYTIDILRTFRVPDEFKKAVPVLGTVLGILEYFVSAGKATAVSASNVNYEIKGTITDSIPGQNSIIYVPGSKWIGDPNGSAVKFKPIYNNTLGTLAVLETPQLNFNSTVSNSAGIPSDVLSYKLNVPSGNTVIKYLINPASGLKSTPADIKCSLIAKFNKEKLFTVVNKILIAPKVSSLVSSIISEEKGTNMVIVQTPLVSFDCIRDFVGSITCKSCRINDIEFRLQIVATLERDDNSGKKTFFSAQYLLNPTGVASISLPTSDDDIANIPVRFLGTDINLTADKTIRAWDDISIKGNINTNGFKLTLIAGSTVNINPASLTPNIDIQIGYPVNCNNIGSPVSVQDVQNFCGSTKYNPIVPSPLVSRDDANSLKSQKAMTSSLSVSPNPFNNLLSIQYELQEPTQVTVSLSNTLGQVVKVLVNERVEAGNYQINESTADLPTGVYIVSMKTPMGIKTQKVVKQNN
jgi:hypothetical protein